jgi:16S rRNA (cytosine1402-N4)-methyltransferase
MLQQVIETLAPCTGESYIDATFGAGGYSRAILEKAACTVVALDRDPEAYEQAQTLQIAYPDRFMFFPGRFSEMCALVPKRSYDGIVFDLGVSSPQLDQASRGFSFKHEGPLDMRMDKEGLTAADVVNTFEEKEIARILWVYGEERRSRAVARAIVEKRKEIPFSTTVQLADLIRKVVGFERVGFDPATRTFQALRLYVNNELGELEEGLKASENLLKAGGRLVVVSFHSLEDRIVKTFLKERSGASPRASRHFPDPLQRKPSFFLKNKKPIAPQEQELKRNPRARSARLRWAIRGGE